MQKKARAPIDRIKIFRILAYFSLPIALCQAIRMQVLWTLYS